MPKMLKEQFNQYLSWPCRRHSGRVVWLLTWARGWGERGVFFLIFGSISLSLLVCAAGSFKPLPCSWPAFGKILILCLLLTIENPYPVPDWTCKIYTLSDTKLDDFIYILSTWPKSLKTIPWTAAYTRIANIGEYPMEPKGYEFDPWPDHCIVSVSNALYSTCASWLNCINWCQLLLGAGVTRSHSLLRHYRNRKISSGLTDHLAQEGIQPSEPIVRLSNFVRNDIRPDRGLNIWASR